MGIPPQEVGVPPATLDTGRYHSLLLYFDGVQNQLTVLNLDKERTVFKVLPDILWNVYPSVRIKELQPGFVFRILNPHILYHISHSC